MSLKRNKQFLSLLLCLITLIFISTSVFAASNVKILSPQNYKNSINETKIINLVSELFNLNNNSYAFNQAKVKPIFTNKNSSTPDYLVVYLLKNDTYYFETKRVNLNSDYTVASIQNNYAETAADRVEFETTYQASYGDDEVEAVFATCCDNIPSAVDGVNEAAKTAEAAGYNVKTLIGAAATVNAYKYWLTKPNVKIFGNIGHGSPSGIALADGTLDNNYFNSLATTALNNKVLYFNSCQVHNNPLEGSILNAGVQKFIGGNINLWIGSSEKVFKYFWTLTLSKGQAMTSSLTQAENDTNYPDKGAHGISGSGSEYVTASNNKYFKIVTPDGVIYQSYLRFDPGCNIIPGDFNGDGKTDFIRQEKGDFAIDNISTFQIYFSCGDGSFNVVEPVGDEYQVHLKADQGCNIIPGDFNGDGKTDFIRQEKNGWDDDEIYSFNVYFSRGNGYFDIATPDGTEYQSHLRFDPGCNIIPGDFNGDGKTDFIRQEKNDWDNDEIYSFNIYFSRGNGYFDIVTPDGTEYQSHLRFDPGCNIITGDFNGDGKTDLIRQEKNVWDDDEFYSFNVYFSRGNGYFDILTPDGTEYQSHLRFDPGCNIITGDFNGDRKTDFIRQEKNDLDNDELYSFNIYFSRGNGYFDILTPDGTEYQSHLRFDPGCNIIPGDFNGDGKTDFIRQEKNDWDNDEFYSFNVYFSI